MFRFLALVWLVVGCAFIAPVVTHAQDAGAGIGLKPALIEENMNPGESRQFTVLISNVSDADQTYYLNKRDITSVRDGGVPVFADADAPKTGFELSEWIALETDVIQVAQGEEKPVSFIINVPENASPCNHFGGVFVSAEPPELRESGAAIGYEVGNIVNIRVAGECTESAQIRQFSTDNYIYGSSEVEFNVKIQNEGNTLVKPTGPLQITNMFGQVVADLIFNEEAAAVFPGSTREYVMVWNGDGPGFGRYEAIVSPVYGEEGAKQTMSSSVSFWILPMNIILPALGVLAFILLVTYIFVRMYVRQKLAYYGAVGSARKLVRRRKESSSSALLLVFTVMLTVTALFLVTLVLLFA
jgi:hypothetical protein